MAVLQGYISASPLGGAVVPVITPQLNSYGLDYWPPHVSATSPTVAAVATPTLPVTVGAQALPGRVVPSYLQDYYYRVHLTPSRIDLGNLVSSQARTIRAWNAWPDRALTLTDVQALNAAGIQLTPPGALPLAFAPLQERAWTINIGTSGPSTIDATLQWLFAGQEPVQAIITGQRLIAWMIPPDWAGGITETLTWLTDVQRATNGTSVREPVRGAPRREWEFGVLVADNDRQVLEAALYDWSARAWALPIWTDVTWLSSDLPAGSSTVALDTSGHDYVVGGLVAIWTSPTSYELAEITNIAAAAITLKQPTASRWPRGARVMPARTAALTDWPTLTRANDRVARAQLRFMAAEPCDWPAIPPSTMYLGIPVLDTRTDEPEDLSASYPRVVVRIDNDVGAIAIDDLSDRAYPTQPYYWRVRGRAARTTLRSLLYWLQGRAQALWLPSWTDDLTLAATASGTTLTVAWAGVTRFLRLRPGRRHLRIELLDGTILYRRVTASVEVDAQTEQLALDAVLPSPIAPRQVRQICWMMLAALNSDRVDISHIHDSEGSATVAVTFAGEPGDEP